MPGLVHENIDMAAGFAFQANAAPTPVQERALVDDGARHGSGDHSSPVPCRCRGAGRLPGLPGLGTEHACRTDSALVLLP